MPRPLSNPKSLLSIVAGQAVLVTAITVLSPESDMWWLLAAAILVALYALAFVSAHRIGRDRFLYFSLAFASAPVILTLFGVLGLLGSIVIGTFGFPPPD